MSGTQHSRVKQNMALSVWQEVVVNWVNCVLVDIDATFDKCFRGRLLARLLKPISSSNGVTWKEAEVSDSDIMEKLTSFIKENFPNYYLDSELYRVMDEEDSEEFVCLLSLILYYHTLGSSDSGQIQIALCNRLNEEMQIRVKTFIQKIPNDNSAVTRTLVKEAALESGSCSCTSPVMFSYSPQTTPLQKAQQHGTPLKCFFQSPMMQQQKRSVLESLEIRKLKSELDAVTCEYTDLQDELNQAHHQIKILNEKYQEKAQELAKLCKEMDSREQEASVVSDKNCNCGSEQKLKQELKSLQNYVKLLEDKVSDLEDASYKLEKRAKHAEHCSADFKKKVGEYENTCHKMREDLETAEERIRYLAEQNLEFRDFIEKQKKELECSTDHELSTIAALPDSAENLGQTVVDLQLHEQIEENKKLRLQLEEKVDVQVDLQKQLQQSQEKLDSLEKELEVLSQQNSLLEKERASEMELLMNEMNEVKRRHSDERNERMAISLELNTSKTTVLKLETDLKASNHQIMELEKQRDALSSQCKNYEAHNETLSLKMKEIQLRVHLLEEEKEYSLKKLETEKAVVKELNDAANTLKTDFLKLKAINEELSLQENQLKFENNTLLENAKMAESRLLGLEEEKSEIYSQLEKANNDVENLENNNKIQNELHRQKTKILEQEIEQLSNNTLSLESQLTALEKHQQQLSQNLEIARLELNKEKQKNFQLHEENSKILQASQENVTKAHDKVVEIQTSLNRDLARVTQERDNIKTDLNQAQEKIQTLESSVQKIGETLNIFQTELHQVLLEFKHALVNFVNVCNNLSEYESLQIRNLDKLLAINVEDIGNIDDKLMVSKCNSADDSDSTVTAESNSIKNLKLFNIKLNMFYEFVLTVCSKCKVLQNETTQFQLDNSEMKKLNEIIARQNNTLTAENASLHSEIQAYKVKEEITKKLDMEIKLLSETVNTLQKEKQTLLEISNKQKLEVEASNAQNKSLLSTSLNMKDEIKELLNQNKQIKVCLAEAQSSLKLGEVYWKLISKKHEADVMFEKIFIGKHQLSQKLIGAHRCLNMIEATYGKQIIALPLTDNIRALKLESEAKLSCVEKEFHTLTKEALSALHTCLDKTRKNIDQYEIIFKNVSKTKVMNTSKDSPGCVSDLSSVGKALSDKCEEHSFTEFFDYITLIELKLQSIERRICNMSSHMELVVDRCKSLETKCNETFNVKPEIPTSSVNASESLPSPCRDDLFGECNSSILQDSLETKTSPHGVTNEWHSFDIAVGKEDFEKTLLVYKIKTEELNEELLSVKLCLSVSESEKLELQKQLKKVNNENEVLRKEKAAVLNLNSKLEDKLKEMEQNYKMRDESNAHHFRASYAALKSEYSTTKAKLSEKENEILEQKRTNIKLNNQFQTEMQKKLLEIRGEYEQKLENLKSKMRTAYQEEVGKIKEKLTTAEEKELLHQNTITKLKSKLHELSSRLASETQEKHFLEKHLYKSRNGSAGQSGGILDELSVQHSSPEEPVFTLPRDVERRQSIASVVDERITYVARRSIQKAVPAGMGRVFHEEDEEGEVFNNTYLADVKAGRCHFGVEGNGNRISELQYRNSLCPPHLKSSYPAETQFHDPSEVKDEDIKITYNKPGPPTPGKKGRLSVQGLDAAQTPRSILKEFNESTISRKGNTPSRIKALFSTKSTRRDENVPDTPRSKRLTLFKKHSRRFQ